MASVIHRIIDSQIRTWEAAAQKRKAEERETHERDQTIRPCITIARMIGAGGWEIGRRLADKLGWQFLDREIVEVIIRQGHFREAIMNALDEHDRSSVELWVDGLLHGRVVDKGDYHRSLVKVLTLVSIHGHAVIVGRGGNFILDSRRALHVRIVAPREARIESLARSKGIPIDQAAAVVKETDHERAAFIMHHFQGRIDDPTAYDLTIDSARFEREAVVELITHALYLKLGNLPKAGL